MYRATHARISFPSLVLLLLAAAALTVPAPALAQQAAVLAQQGSRDEALADVTFTRDVAPILQRSCVHCHRPNGVAPMSLATYEDARPYATRMMRRTGIRDRMGTMPPWYVEKDIGIQHFKDDPSLSDEEVATIAQWARSGAPEGDPADMPPPLEFDDTGNWRLGEPDLVLTTDEFLVEAGKPDWWGDITPIPTGLTEDRYVASVEIREVNDVPQAGTGRETVGGRYVIHHVVWSTVDLDNPEEGRVGWPVHEVGRNPDIFDPRGGRLLRAGSSIVSSSTHLHSNGRDTRARLQFGFKFHPEGYEPEYRPAPIALANGSDIDIRAGEKDQELHAYHVLEQHTKLVTFEPHLHAPGMRMCLEAIWGFNIETLSCVGYDHNWVRGYAFDDDHQPLLPEGAVLHIIGYMDNTEGNMNIPDPRNWQGSGNRSVANMFIDLGMQLALTDEQFEEAMAERREKLNLGPNDHVIGCPLCMVIPEGGR
jgi:mono/diheme cytochrome c family protein